MSSLSLAGFRLPSDASSTKALVKTCYGRRDGMRRFDQRPISFSTQYKQSPLILRFHMGTVRIHMRSPLVAPKQRVNWSLSTIGVAGASLYIVLGCLLLGLASVALLDEPAVPQRQVAALPLEREVVEPRALQLAERRVGVEQ